MLSKPTPIVFARLQGAVRPPGGAISPQTQMKSLPSSNTTREGCSWDGPVASANEPPKSESLGPDHPKHDLANRARSSRNEIETT